MSRSKRINESQLPTLRLVSDTASEISRVLSPYGPVRVGLTTTQATQKAQLMASLSSLEKQVATLESKVCELYATLVFDMERLVELLRSTIDTDITDDVI